MAFALPLALLFVVALYLAMRGEDRRRASELAGPRRRTWSNDGMAYAKQSNSRDAATPSAAPSDSFDAHGGSFGGGGASGAWGDGGGCSDGGGGDGGCD